MLAADSNLDLCQSALQAGRGEARQASKWRAAKGLPQAHASVQAEVANQSWDIDAAPHCQCV
jgi:hypothetical protein